MKILDFIKSIPATMERASVRSGLVNTTQEFNRFNKPLFSDATKQFGSLSFKSPWNKAFEKDLEVVSGAKTRGNAIAMLDAINTVVEPLLPELANMLDEYFNDDFSNESITIQRYNILQLIEAVTLYVDYSRRYLITALRKENNLEVKSVGGENDGILPYDLKWLAENRDTFLKVVKIISGKLKVKDIATLIENMPEYTVSSANPATARNEREVDPLGFGFISTRMNPIFFIRMQVAKVQVARLQAAELEAQELEFRILALRASLDGKPDAKKEALANALEDKQLNPLREKIAKWTEEYTDA